MGDESPPDEYTPPNLNEEESAAWQQMAPEAKRRLQEYDPRIRPIVEGRRVWASLLTEVERDSLGGNLEEAWWAFGTLGMWIRAKGYTNRFVALAELVEALTSPAWLLREASRVGSRGTPTTERPVWNPRTGVLSLANEPIRRGVRRLRHPSNIQRILDAFQDAGLPGSIDNPLGDVHDETKLHQAVHQLNQSLHKIRFSVSQGKVIWTHTDD